MDVPEVLLKKILYTTDLSEAGRFAFAYAASLSRRYEADLTALHVVDEGPEIPSRLLGYMDEKVWEEIKQRDLDEARQILISRKRDNTVIKKCVGDYCEKIQNSSSSPNVAYDIIIKFGNPVEQIISQAQDGKYDIIVMSNIGHNPLIDAVLGSTAQRVLRRSKIPVLVVRTPI